jgi:hypothetical protein
LDLFRVGTARCAVRAGLRRNLRLESHITHYSFRPLNAGGDSAARCPYQNLKLRFAFNLPFIFP